MKYVILDFNGTIVDDLDLCIESMNESIEKYLDRGPLDREEYYEKFGFPVKDYYEKVGFDFDELDWTEVGQSWMGRYIDKRSRSRVHDGIVDFLIENHDKGNKNIVLSASRTDNLVDHLKELNIYQYFDEVLGIDNIYASSKIQTGLDFVKDKNKEDCLMIVDSIHDLETANEMGIRCILIAKGHQKKEKLEAVCDEVYDDIREVRI